MRFKKLVVVGVGAVLIAGIVAAIVVWQKESSLKVFESEKVSFKYPKEYREQPKTVPSLNRAETLAKFKVDQPLSIIEFAEEKGAIIGANLTKTNFLDFLERSADLSFPSVYQSYQKIKSERIKVSGHDAAWLSFSYLGTDGKTALYLNLFIIPLGNDAYYLTIQSASPKKLDSDTARVQPTIVIK